MLGLVCADAPAAKAAAEAAATATTDSRSAASLKKSKKTTVPSRATLIVVPPPLLRQWEAECKKCVAEGALVLRVYQGNRGRKQKNCED